MGSSPLRTLSGRCGQANYPLTDRRRNMTDKVVATKPGNGQALANYGSRAEVLEFVGRLRTMLPGGDKLSDGQIEALAQASLATGLDPLNGEIWMTDKGLMIGVKGLRRKGHEQIKGNYWTEFRPIIAAAERELLQITEGALAFEARLFDSENLRTYVETCERLMKAGLPWEDIKVLIGNRPYMVGLGIFKKGEPSRMPPAQCAQKRAEADALKRRFDIGFADIPIEGEPEQDWVEVTAQQHAPLAQDVAQAEPSQAPASNAALDAIGVQQDTRPSEKAMAAAAEARRAANAKTKKALEQSDKF